MELRHFEPYEFKMGSEIVFDKMNKDFLLKLDELRERCDIVFNINSSFRDPKYNSSVKGGTNSYHVLGRAVDIKCLYSNDRAIILKNALNMGLSCGIYKTWIHIDDRDDQIVYVG